MERRVRIDLGRSVMNGSEFETLRYFGDPAFILTSTNGQTNESNKDESWYKLYQKHDNLLL